MKSKLRVFRLETFEKYSILFKVKSKIPDFERGKAKILTYKITTPVPGSKVQGSEVEKQRKP